MLTLSKQTLLESATWATCPEHRLVACRQEGGRAPSQSKGSNLGGFMADCGFLIAHCFDEIGHVKFLYMSWQGPHENCTIEVKITWWITMSSWLLGSNNSIRPQIISSIDSQNGTLGTKMRRGKMQLSYSGNKGHSENVAPSHLLTEGYHEGKRENVKSGEKNLLDCLRSPLRVCGNMLVLPSGNPQERFPNVKIFCQKHMRDIKDQ